MNEMMTFPETWEEYEKQYGFADDEEVYTNGSRLIQSFRVKQWLDHLPSAEPERKKGKWIRITQGAMPEQYICPFCHRTVEVYDVEKLLPIRYPYCHCGADMRGEDDG